MSNDAIVDCPLVIVAENYSGSRLERKPSRPRFQKISEQFKPDGERPGLLPEAGRPGLRPLAHVPEKWEPVFR
jgi:hypothetical protein